MKIVNLSYASAALGSACLSPTSAFTVLKKPTTNLASSSMVAKPASDGESMSTRSRYKQDMDALDRLLDAREEEKLEEIRALIKDIQETRKNMKEAVLPHKVRDALADYHRAESQHGRDSREAEVAHEYFLDVSCSENMRPEHYYREVDEDARSVRVLEEALEAVDHLEELKEIAHVEKSVLDRFGSTDFEIGEGLLERGIGRDDPDLTNDYDLWT